jgi:hypothetical protein
MCSADLCGEESLKLWTFSPRGIPLKSTLPTHPSDVGPNVGVMEWQAAGGLPDG